MKVLIAHDSRTGNGRRIAEAIADVCRESGAEVRIGHYSELDTDAAIGLGPDLLVAGTAVRMFQLSRLSKKWMRALGRGLRARGVSIGYASVFMTHGLPAEKAARWGRRFQHLLERTPGIKSVDPEWHSGRVVDTEGPLEEGVIERFRGIAAVLVDAVRGD